MSGKNLLSVDPLTGLKTSVIFDRAAGKFHVDYESERGQEDALLDLNTHQANKKKYNYWGDGKDGMRKIATFSPFAQMLWLNTYGYSPLDMRYIRQTRKILNDPEWRKLKTSSEVL